MPAQLGRAGDAPAGKRKIPLRLPWFITGFLLIAAINSIVAIPKPVQGAAATGAQALLLLAIVATISCSGDRVVDAPRILARYTILERSRVQWPLSYYSDSTVVHFVHTEYLTFDDTGKGMSQEQVEQLFEPFSSSTSGGTGLGLSIVYQIVRDHNGAINVRSREGKGTTITIELPKENRPGNAADDTAGKDGNETQLNRFLNVKSADTEISS